MRKLPGFIFALLFSFAAFAQSPLTTLGVGGIAIVEAFGISYSSVVSSTTDLTTYTFTGVDMGAPVTAGNTRYTLIAGGGQTASGNITLDAVTVCGNAATQIANSGLSSLNVVGIFRYDATLNSQFCDVTMTFSVNATRAYVSAYRMVNPGSSTATDTACANAATAGITLDLDIAASGVAIGTALNTNGGVWTWAGLTENFDQDIESSDNATGAIGGSAGTPHAVSPSTVGATAKAGCTASWAP